MKTAFIFAGQGAQYVQMQKDFYDNYAVAKSIMLRWITISKK